jgi:anti-sigma regulatory factor (Ser/Thr protein kinase)
MTTEAVDPRYDGFRHEALLYRGAAEFVDATSAFLADGVAAGEPALVVVSADKIAALRSALGGDAEAVRFADMAEVGANPGRIIPAWREFVDEHAGSGRRFRGIGEPIWPERTPPELLESQHHEVLLNVAFNGHPSWWLLCPYDIDALDSAIVEEAFRSHPFVMRDGAQHPSTAYRDVSALRGPFDDALPEPTARPETRVYSRGPLHDLREFVFAKALDAGVGHERAHDLVLAVDELIANSRRHAHSSATLRVWRDPSWLFCEVADTGRIDEPLADRTTPAPESESGWGLWLVNQLCDLVQLRSSAAGTIVRLHMRRD